MHAYSTGLVFQGLLVGSAGWAQCLCEDLSGTMSLMFICLFYLWYSELTMQEIVSHLLLQVRHPGTSVKWTLTFDSEKIMWDKLSSHFQRSLLLLVIYPGTLVGWTDHHKSPNKAKFLLKMVQHNFEPNIHCITGFLL